MEQTLAEARSYYEASCKHAKDAIHDRKLAKQELEAVEKEDYLRLQERYSEECES